MKPLILVLMSATGSLAAPVAAPFQEITQCLNEFEASVKQLEQKKTAMGTNSGPGLSSPMLTKLEATLAADQLAARRAGAGASERRLLEQKIHRDQQAIAIEKSELRILDTFGPKGGSMKQLFNDAGAQSVRCDELINAFEPKSLQGLAERRSRFTTLSVRLRAVSPGKSKGKTPPSKER